MALRMVLLLAVLLFCFAHVSIAEGDVENVDQIVKGANRRMMDIIDCDAKCGVRCSLHSRPNVCKRACGTCCNRCKCVPSGTYGNKEECGDCYVKMTTHGNKPKCP
ncbi:Gibberellin-regulated family protein [Thalictrum thalictroides]|uniref:Gibberellin-regulated family protein n=1 Tax=Thalictrum thalictroides TaxID=46969 RepID=A0A7J6WLG3_THATH|nr:Gibberellin-regulated family protein [Thalictrum thalictroides]